MQAGEPKSGEPIFGQPGGRDAEFLRAMIDRIDPFDPGGFNNLGVVYFSKGMYADAVSAFLRALEIDPRMRTAARNLEVAATKPGACDTRLEALRVRLHDAPDNRAARLEHARLLRLIGRSVDASHELDALIASDPDDGASLFERGLVEQRAGDLRRAQRWFERAVNAHAANSVAQLHLAEVLYQRGQNEQALEALDALVEQDAGMADAHLLRGFVLGDMGHHEAAMSASRTAATLNPSLQSLQSNLSLEHVAVVVAPDPLALHDTGLARYGLGLAFRQRGYFKEARAEFARALEHGEDARLTRHALAELDLIAGRFAQARTTLASLLRDESSSPRFWNEQGVALHQGGDVHGAADSYRAALRLDPRSAIAYNNLGVALSDAGDQNAAREALLRAAELDPSLVRARLNCARWFQSNRNGKVALAMLRELVAFHPGDADALHALGSVCHELGWFDEARHAFARAIEQRPQHAEARYGLADVLGALGDEDGALRETQQALALSPVRTVARLSVIIELQRECPDACGNLDLLSLREGSPLVGVALLEQQVRALLPEAELIVDPVDADSDLARALLDADRFAARGLHGEALERYERARVSLEPAHAEPESDHYGSWRHAAIGESRSRCMLGHGEDAYPLLKRLGSRDTRDLEVLALFACSSVRVQQPAPALIIVARILLRAPASAALMHFVGDVALSAGNAEQALSCYRRALSLDASRPSARVAIARLLRVRGDLVAARLELLAALSAAPGWRDATLELVELHRAADRVQDALSLLTTHLERTPTDLDALVLLGETLARLGRNDDARVAALRVLRHDPAHGAALWLDGVLLARQSRVRDAVERWRRIAEYNADDALASKAQRAIDETGLSLPNALLSRIAS